jgi:hypothetical protein
LFPVSSSALISAESLFWPRGSFTELHRFLQGVKKMSHGHHPAVRKSKQNCPVQKAKIVEVADAQFVKLLSTSSLPVAERASGVG